MKKIYFSALALLGIGIMNAQVYNVGYDAQVTGISDEGTAVGNINGAEHFMWSKEDGGRLIGNTSDLGVSGNTSISSDGIFISATVVNPDTGKEAVGIYVPILGDEWLYLPQLNDNSESAVFGMSSGGDFNVGLGWVSGGSVHATVWAGPNSPIDLGSTVAGRSSRANDVNLSGDVVVGWQDSDEGYRQGVYWLNKEQHFLKDNDGNILGEALTVSQDGKTIAGFTLDGDGYIWNETEGTIIYSHPDEDYISSIAAISDDGNTAVGFSYPFFEGMLFGEAFVWFKDSGFHKLDDYVAEAGFDNLGISFAVATAISANGNFVGGVGVDWEEMEVKGFIIDISSILSNNTVVPMEFTVYPNPVKDILTISATANLNSVEVFNLLGKKVASFEDVKSGQINLSGLSNGVYIVKLNSEEGSKAVKVIKE